MFANYTSQPHLNEISGGETSAFPMIVGGAVDVDVLRSEMRRTDYTAVVKPVGDIAMGGALNTDPEIKVSDLPPRTDLPANPNQ